MKCQYRFPVIRGPRLKVVLPIPLGGTEYVLERNAAGVVTAILATLKIADENLWPRITPNPAPGIKANLSLHHPGLDKIKAELRTIEGLLAIYGLSAIEIDAHDEKWEAESAEEQAQLQVFSFGPTRQAPPDTDRHFLTFDIVARSFFAAPHAYLIEVALSFFRKGRNDFLEKRHIEAVYDFYFMFETLFGNGKTKNYQVKAEFKKAPVLRSALEEIIAKPQPLAHFRPHPNTRATFQKHYGGKSVEEVIDFIVELRGFLHHHTAGRPGMWHPEGHRPYECHAMVLTLVAQSIAFGLSENHMFNHDAVTKYERAFEGVAPRIKDQMSED